MPGGKKKGGKNSAEDSLDAKRRQKRKKFAWLAKFFSKRPAKEELVASGIMPAEPEAPLAKQFFGLSCSEVYAHEDRLIQDIPKPLYYAAEALRPWMIIEGVFRVSGIFSEMNRLKAAFERGETPDFDAVDSKHSISGLLEMWFRELPEPITTHALYDEFMQAATVESEYERLEILSGVIQKLPEANIKVLSFFTRVLREVAQLEHENKMGTSNLGVVFGSILLGPGSLMAFSLGMKETLNNQNRIVQWLIEHCRYLFPRDDDPEEDEEGMDEGYGEEGYGADDYYPPPPDEDEGYSAPPMYAPPPGAVGAM